MHSAIQSSQELVQQLHHNGFSTSQPLGSLLIETGLINADQLHQALQLQSSKPELGRLGQALISLGFAKPHDILCCLSHQLSIPIVDVTHFEIDDVARQMISEEVARAYGVMPLMLDEDRLVVAVSDPTNGDLLNTLHFVSGHMIEPVLARQDEIDIAIARYYGGVDGIVQSLLDKQDINLKDREVLTPTDLAHIRQMAEDKPTIRFVENLIKDAISRRASDIHIRPRANNVGLLFRIDGALIEVRTINSAALAAIVSRFKIIGNMNIAEHRLPQDGRHKLKVEGHLIDLRLSVIPTVHGESLVIRILDTRQSLSRITDLGFNDHDAARFSEWTSHNQGLILVTGPTGSGKTTTLYAALNEIRDRNLNIITVEDPVEYEIDNILQVQVKPKIGYTFSRTLRHILRHDPDVIMVGEVRDAETALMTMESALTGHLVLSTLHTNSAATAVTRLLELGAEPYLLNATLLGVLAQRLVRRNCPHCLVEETCPEHLREALQVSPEEIFYEGEGCDACQGLGFKGRIATYELLSISSSMKQLIKPGVQAMDIEAQALAEKMVPLTQHALRLTREKVISLKEAYRVRLE